LVSFEGLLHFWRETQIENANKKYMMIMLSGHFKGEVDSRWHMAPISNKTHSNIPFCLWMERIMLKRVNYQHHSKGWFVQDKDKNKGKVWKVEHQIPIPGGSGTGNKLPACPQHHRA
jgi:hypothetical protein